MARRMELGDGNDGSDGSDGNDSNDGSDWRRAVGAPAGSSRVADNIACLNLSRNVAADVSGRAPDEDCLSVLSPELDDDRTIPVGPRLALVWDTNRRVQVTARSFNSDRATRPTPTRRAVSIFFERFANLSIDTICSPWRGGRISCRRSRRG